MIRKEVRRFTQKEVAPRVEECERSGEFPYDIMNKMAELGFMGIPFPKEYGGLNRDWVGMHLCFEEISHIDTSLGGLLDVTTSVMGQEIAVFESSVTKRPGTISCLQGIGRQALRIRNG